MNKRWINTKVEFIWDGTQYVEISSDGYWYDGEIAFAQGETTFTGDIIFDETSGTTDKIKFGNVNWGNNIGLESYWSIYSTNSNEGFKFRDDDDEMLLQINGSTHSSPKNATFAGEVSVNKDWYDDGNGSTSWGGGINMYGTAPSIKFWENDQNRGWMWHVSENRMLLYTRASGGSWFSPVYWDTNGDATFAGRVDVTQSGNSILVVGSTGTGQADIVVDASNGDASGGDYAFFSQYNDLSASVGTASNAGNFLLKSKGSTALTLDGTNATFAGNATFASQVLVQKSAEDDSNGYIQVYNDNTTAGSSGVNFIAKNYYGTTQLFQWRDSGARIGTRTSANGGAGNLYLTVNDSAQLTLTSTTATFAGDVGIGTSGLADGSERMLKIYGHGNSGDSTLGIVRFFNDSTAIAQIDVSRQDDDTSGQFAIRTNDSNGGLSERFTIKPDGNVGIGDDTPSYKLEVAGTFYASGSSQAFKKNVTDLAVDSSAIYNLNPVSYNYKKDYENFGYDLAEGKQFGLISEEVAESVPELAIMKDGEPKNVDYQKLSVLLLAEMQKMNKRIKDLECHI